MFRKAIDFFAVNDKVQAWFQVKILKTCICHHEVTAAESQNFSDESSGNI